MFAVPARLVTDDARLLELLTQALDQLAAHARASAWLLQGAPSAFIFQPDHAAALGLYIPLPRTPTTTGPHPQRGRNRGARPPSRPAEVSTASGADACGARLDQTGSGAPNLD